MQDPTQSPLTYRDAGVDIDQGAALVDRIKPAAKATHRAGVLGGLGGFGGLFKLAPGDYKNPILVSSTDGVGTKLKIAIALDRHETIGIDLVAMCVNDVVVQGAEPLFFLDYFATGALDVATASKVIIGIADGCRIAGAALLGGETAEMPEMYAPGHYDLAGFCVGAVEAERLIDGSRIQAGDVILGLASSGVHSNGYSLVRRVLAKHGIDLQQTLGSDTLGELLLAPTRIYVKPLLEVFKRYEIGGLAHITGGGITDNLPRVLPARTYAHIDLSTWPLPPIFQWLRDTGPIDTPELLRTFNCGLGMLVVTRAAAAAEVKAMLETSGERVFVVGSIAAGEIAERVQYGGRLD